MFTKRRFPLTLLSVAFFVSTDTKAVEMSDVLAELQMCSPELISGTAALAVASGSVEAKKAMRLPTFSLNANARKFANSSDSTGASLEASYTLVSFGKQDAEEAAADSNLLVENRKLESNAFQTLADLFKKQSSYRRLSADNAILSSILEAQQLVLDRVERRAALARSSDSDRNAVFSKVWQNKNRISNNELEKRVLLADIEQIDCTQGFSTLTLDSLPIEASENDAMTPGFLNAELRLLQARIESKQTELAAKRLSLLPDVNVVGSVPISKKADEESNIGLEFSVQYGNLGQVVASQVDALAGEIEALQQELSVSSSRRVKALVSHEERILALKNEIIPNQRVSVDSIQQKLDSKERLFKAGRVSLFELLSTYDELLNAQLDLNRYQADLEQVEIDRATSLDFVYR